MNFTGTSVNVHSQMCFDIKFSANKTDKIQSITFRFNPDIYNGDKVESLELFHKFYYKIVSCLLWCYRPDSNWYA